MHTAHSIESKSCYEAFFAYLDLQDHDADIIPPVHTANSIESKSCYDAFFVYLTGFASQIPHEG